MPKYLWKTNGSQMCECFISVHTTNHKKVFKFQYYFLGKMNQKVLSAPLNIEQKKSCSCVYVCFLVTSTCDLLLDLSQWVMFSSKMVVCVFASLHVCAETMHMPSLAQLPSDPTLLHTQTHTIPPSVMRSSTFNILPFFMEKSQLDVCLFVLNKMAFNQCDQNGFLLQAPGSTLQFPLQIALGFDAT